SNNENKGKAPESSYEKTDESACYRCGKKGHWANVYRTSKHFVELYQASLNDKGKDAEINFIDQTQSMFSNSLLIKIMRPWITIFLAKARASSNKVLAFFCMDM
ncbi:C2HC-type zinc finger protein, partial [Zoogloea oryzae]|uniref:C2HC-type zinc finger protein n=1 Tax=Zoogloea oryzae TaxID=310767 RepID=UPI0024E1311F